MEALLSLIILLLSQVYVWKSPSAFNMIEETNRNAVAISLISGAKHRTNGDTSIFHVKKIFLFL